MLLDRLLSSLEVRVEPFSLCEVGAGGSLHLPGSIGVTLHFVLVGSGFVRSGTDRLRPIAPCTLAVVPSGMEHALEPDDGAGESCPTGPGGDAFPSAPVVSAGTAEPVELVVACGYVKVSYGSALGLFDRLDDVLVEDLSDVPQVRSAFAEILAEQSGGAPGSEALKAALMSQCIVHFLRRICESGTCTPPWLAALDDDRLARVVERILRGPGDPHTMESLSRIAGMSRSAFADAFTRAFGMPPMSMVRRARMERAWALLGRGDALPMETVASRVGFTSRTHFSKAFKKHFGVSPAARRAMPD